MLHQKKCWLNSVNDANVKVLLHNNVEIILGRSPETNINDKRCSRNQVSLTADYNSETVTVKHLGGNPCSAKNIILKNDSLVLKHGEMLEFLVGQFKFEIKFDPVTVKNDFKKRKNEDDETVVNSTNSKKCRVDGNGSAAPVKCEKNMWEKIDDGKLYVFTSAGVTSSSKIAAYDLDGTIILTKSGRVFPKDNDDWKLANGSVKTKIASYESEGFKIVILTNQAGIGRGKTNINEFKSKVEKIVSSLNVPVQVFIATSTSIYRKPAPGMWNYLETMKNDGVKIDMTVSFYVGDAAGRVVNWAPGKKKDFSFADRLLAVNLNLRFFTPEEHFLKHPPGKYGTPLFNPTTLDENTPISDGRITSTNKEVVVMVGYPGSGKSYFVRQHLVTAGYVHVNRDTLGSWQKCVAAMESALSAGRSVVIDNTNPDRESRKRFIDKASVPCRCFVMMTSVDHVRHNIRFRELTDKKHLPVNEMILHSYKNKFEKPSLQEGFTEIVNINFVPSFSDDEQKKLYRMYLLEK